MPQVLHRVVIRPSKNCRTGSRAGAIYFMAKLAPGELIKAPLDLHPTLGATLTLNPRKECFTGEFSGTANTLLTRKYRQPFGVPELV